MAQPSWSRPYYDITHARLYSTTRQEFNMTVVNGGPLAEATVYILGTFRAENKFRKSGNLIPYDEMVAKGIAEMREQGFEFTEKDFCSREDYERRYDNPVQAAKDWCIAQAHGLGFTLTTRPAPLPR